MTPIDDSASKRRARNAEATRADLVQAASRRFTVLGYDRTTTRDVAADAGVNASLIKRYFGSKDGLLQAVMSESANLLAQLPDTGPASLLESMLSNLDPADWPEFGSQHPLLLLLSDVGANQAIDELRHRSLEAVITRLADQLSGDGSNAGGVAAVPSDRRLRAELVVGLIAGVLTVRAKLANGALERMSADQLGVQLEGLARFIAAT